MPINHINFRFENINMCRTKISYSNLFKIIITICIFLIVVNFFILYENINYENFITHLNNYITLKVKPIYIVLFLILYLLAVQVFKKNNIIRKYFYDKKQLELIGFNSMIDFNTNSCIKWKTDFKNNKPFVYDIEIYCIKHNPEKPLKLVGNKCPSKDCNNSIQQINPLIIQSLIESNVIDRWEKINLTH